MLWDEKELEYIRANEAELEKIELPLNYTDLGNFNGSQVKLATKLSIALGILRGRKFTFVLTPTRDKNIKVIMLRYFIFGKINLKDGRNIGFYAETVNNLLDKKVTSHVAQSFLVNSGFVDLSEITVWADLIIKNSNSVLEEFEDVE